MTKIDDAIWQEVNPETSQTHDFNKDPIVQGVYASKKENVGENKSNIYILAYKGENIGVWGSTVLDGRFEQIAIGSEVKIEYIGMKKSEKGGREYKDFKVFIRPVPFKEVGKDDLPVIDQDIDEANSTLQINADA